MLHIDNQPDLSGLTMSVDTNRYPFRLLVGPREMITPAIAEAITAYRDEYLCAVLWPWVDHRPSLALVHALRDAPSGQGQGELEEGSV